MINSPREEPELGIVPRFERVFARRSFLGALVAADLKLRYRGSSLGFLWTLANPLAILVIFTFVFTKVVKIEVANFPLFMLVGLLPWNFTTTALQNGSASLVRYRRFFNFVEVASELFPLAEVLAALYNFLLTLLVLFVGLAAFGVRPTLAFLMLPVIISVHLLLLIAAALILCVSFAYWRETSNALDLALVFLFYATPIFYPVEMIPAEYLDLYLLNPFACLTILYQDALLFGRVGNLELLAYPFVVAIVLLYVGARLFSKGEAEFAEVV
jgi:lipopolysaccharide transport system permease protein